jgi:beta-lactam-binding protein with PASTA domain
MGELSYRNDLRENTVIGQLIGGNEIKKDALVPKGSKINLVVGDGLGNVEMEIPDLVGKTIEEAKLILAGSNLNFTVIQYDPAAVEPPGTIIRQNPASGEGNKIRVGDIIDLWVAGEAPPKQEGDGTK